jgi:probable HAF family extracellular repeat protein
VNDSGQVVGYSHTASGWEHAFSWTQTGGMVDLDTLGGTWSWAYAVNASGQVVGYSFTTGDAVYHAFSWTQAGGMVDLGTLGGTYSYPYAVNNSGQVVGCSTTTSGLTHATLWQIQPEIVNKCPAFGNEVAGMIETLIANVDAINLKKKNEEKLIHELDKALKEVGQCDQKNACKGIEKFIKDVQKKKLDKHFEPGEEAALLLQANAIRVKLGCS